MQTNSTSATPKRLQIIRAVDVGSQHLDTLLDSYFHPELVSLCTPVMNNNSSLDNSHDADVRMTADAHRLLKSIPKEDFEFLNFISEATNYFHLGNHRGRFCTRFVWPWFFERFPAGSILIFALDGAWHDRTFSEGLRFVRSLPEDSEKTFLFPQGMSGLTATEFPRNVLLLPSLGIYPLVCGYPCSTASDLIFVYIPDRCFEHSQIMDSGSFTNVLWMLHHVLDDQWTFDGSRGPKSKIPDDIPVADVTSFFCFVTDLLSLRMHELLEKPFLEREQLAMTYSRAVSDTVLAVSSELPYMAKVFFFASLDKIANILVRLGSFSDETDAWKYSGRDWETFKRSCCRGIGRIEIPKTDCG